jgi:methylated-DNA-protein-cysteine methyltransferase-like protein
VTHLTERIYAVVAAIPEGRILSYGDVAALAGRPQAPRAVGAALSKLPEGLDIPWWRVVSSTGKISTSSIHHTAQIQRALLEDEGVVFGPSGHVDWDRFGWSANVDAVSGTLAEVRP